VGIDIVAWNTFWPAFNSGTYLEEYTQTALGLSGDIPADNEDYYLNVV